MASSASLAPDIDPRLLPFRQSLVFHLGQDPDGEHSPSIL